MDAPKPVYDDLLNLVADKDYFVITTNVDHCFQKAGFDKKRLFYTQGDYGLFQCSKPCHRGTYDNEETVKKMVVNNSGEEAMVGYLPAFLSLSIIYLSTALHVTTISGYLQKWQKQFARLNAKTGIGVPAY